MPVVYVVPPNLERHGATLFHKNLECRQLTKRPARGVKHTPVEMDLNEVEHPRPCQICYPDAPVPRSVHRRCDLCNTTRVNPCPHNGGVPVLHSWSWEPSADNPAGDTYQYEIYVWPERAHLYL